MKITQSLLIMFFSITIAACGGGGGGGDSSASKAATSSLSGVAAVGAPIANGSIQIICAGGDPLATSTDNTGAWEVTISGQTLPCAIEVSGGTINSIANTIDYHSIATSFGTVNITPLTDLLLANLTGMAAPDTWFAGLSSSTLTPITSNTVNTSLANQCAALSGLTQLCTHNPVTTFFITASANTMYSMLVALQMAMLDTGVSYDSLLGNAADAGYSAPVAGFNAALTDAYITATGSISAIATTTAQSLTVGTAMASFTPLTASGGTPPYTYSYTGTLPAGLIYNSSTGIVSGAPTATYTISALVFSVKDANDDVASTTSMVSFTVGAATVDPIAFAVSTAQKLTVGMEMNSFSPLLVSGGTPPYTFSYTGTLPDGLIFNTSTGAVTGIPTTFYEAANLVFSVKDAADIVAITTSSVSFSVSNWSTTGSMVNARNGATGTLLDDGRVLITGGANTLALASAELYDPATGLFTATGSMGAGRYYHSSTKLSNGKVLIVGGIGSSYTAVASAELYDPSTGKFTGTGSMSTSRSSFRLMPLANGKVMVIGGSLGTTTLATAEVYDPDTELFTATGSMVTARSSFAVTRLADGKVLVAGGTGAGVSAEIYDPDTGLFTATGDMVVGRYSAASIRLPDGKVLITGGQGNLITNLGQFLASAEVYDPDTGEFTAVADMAYPRVGFLAVVLPPPNGKVLIAGGDTGLSATTSAELFDPSTGHWSATGSMLEAKWLSVGVLLPGGEVLIAGGTSYNSASNSAELYHP